GALIVPCMMLLLGWIDPHRTALAVFCMASVGLGLGLQLPTSMVAVQNIVPYRHIGIATAVTAFFRSLGAAIGIAVMLALLLALLQQQALALHTSLSGAEIIRIMVGHAANGSEAALRLQLEAPVQHAFQIVFSFGAAVALVALLLAVLIPDDVLGDKLVRN
ncbi:MAG: MFS transporter, partial [Herbaspirillum sp.]